MLLDSYNKFYSKSKFQFFILFVKRSNCNARRSPVICQFRDLLCLLRDKNIDQSTCDICGHAEIEVVFYLNVSYQHY